MGSTIFTYNFKDGTTTDQIDLTVATPARSTQNGTGYIVTAVFGSINGASISGEVGSGGVEGTIPNSGNFVYDNTVFASNASGGSASKDDGIVGSMYGIDDEGIEFRVGNTEYNFFYEVNSLSAFTGFELFNATTGASTDDLTLVSTNAPCYVSGTLIRTASGDVAVEYLRIGDVAVTASGTPRPISWIGSRLTHCRRHPRPQEVQPVRIAAHAFGENRPARDLLVSPAHALCVDVLGEVLIPACRLINGTTITQEDVDSITYWHVELEGGHDVILAENMPAESYIEMDNRGFFAESGIVALDAHPDAPAAVRSTSDFCRPFHEEGAVVEAVRLQLQARAESLGWRLEDGGLGDLHLLADGRRVDPKVRGLAARFSLPEDAREVWLVSNTSSPSAVTGLGDPRRLGVCVAAITIDDGFGAPRIVAADDPRLGEGFHDVEGNGAAGWRWTSGCALLPQALWDGLDGEVSLRVDLTREALPRWSTPAARACQLGLADAA